MKGIHCLDEESDWKAYQENDVLQYLLDTKKSGAVQHIGFSTHTPSLANRVLDTGLVDQLMFSVNPGYDYQHGDYANGSTNERMDLYRRCEMELEKRLERMRQNERIYKKHKWIKVVGILFVILLLLLLAALLFLKLWPAFGGRASAEDRKDYEARAENYRDGRFYNDGDFQIVRETEQA